MSAEADISRRIRARWCQDSSSIGVERDLRSHLSRQVIDALGRALRLTPAERSHLHQLAHGDPPPTTPATPEALAPAVAALVQRLDPYPTYVTGRRFDVLAANRAARAVWTEWPTLASLERNLLWWMFTDPGARTTLVEWETEACALLARFRTAADRHPHDPEFASLIHRLHAASAEVRAWWPRHDIVALTSGTKRLRHPLLGELTLHHVVLQLAEDPEQKLLAFTPSDPDLQRIAALLTDQDR